MQLQGTQRQKKSTIPISLQTMLIAAAGLVLVGALTVFGSAYTVNGLKNKMVATAREEAQASVTHICEQITQVIQERGATTVGELANDPEIIRLIRVISDQGSIIFVQLKDADGYPIREIRCDRKIQEAAASGTFLQIATTDPASPGGSDPGGPVSPDPDATQRPITIQVPIRFDNHVRGHLLVNLSPALAMGGVQALSDQISSSLLVMVLNVFAILLLTIVLVYYTFRRQMELQRQTTESEHLANLGAIASGLAHEIRNPLHAMNLHLEVAREDLETGEYDREDTAETIGRVQRQIENLNGIVSNFLNLAMPSGLTTQEMRLDQLVNEVVGFLQPEFDSRQIDVVVELPGEISIRGDARALHQVLLNILLNAAHVLEKQLVRKVSIRAERDRRHWRLLVDDSGPGVPEGEEETIFTAFVSKRCGGTGFGLCIARKIMEGHNGRIGARRSQALGGAQFFLEFPERAASQPAQAEVPAVVG